MKIVFDKRIPGLEEGIASLSALATGERVEMKPMEGAGISAADVKDADAVVVRTRTRCDASLLSGSRVRLVATATIGTDHVDIPWCEGNGIRVVNAPGCNAPAVMQYVAASLDRSGFDPAVHTLGIIGKGHIGSLIASLYRDAGTEVLVCDPPRKDAGWTDEDYLTLREVLSRSHAVSFHVPYDATTHHMLTGKMLRMYPGAGVLVNASRGGIWSRDVFESGRTLIVDTWPFEEEGERWDPRERKRIIDAAFIATPHIAGYSVEGKRRATEAMLHALSGYIFSLPDNQMSQRCADSVETYGVIPLLKDVVASFNPMPISSALKHRPEDFEALRSSHLRPEA